MYLIESKPIESENHLHCPSNQSYYHESSSFPTQIRKSRTERAEKAPFSTSWRLIRSRQCVAHLQLVNKRRTMVRPLRQCVVNAFPVLVSRFFTRRRVKPGFNEDDGTLESLDLRDSAVKSLSDPPWGSGAPVIASYN